MVDKLNEDNKFSGRAGATVIEILDRMESQKKPELAAIHPINAICNSCFHAEYEQCEFLMR